MTATVRGVSAKGRGGSIDLKGVKEYTFVYKVTTSDKLDGSAAVRTATGIPNIGDTYSVGNDSDALAVVVNKTVEQNDESPFEWEVTITCSNDVEEDPANNIYQDNPLNARVKKSYGVQTRKILVPGRYNTPGSPPASKDWEQGIFLPNGEILEPQPEAEIDEPIWTFKKNVASVDGPTLMALNNCVNSDKFQGAEPRQVRMRVPVAEEQWHKSIGYYWEVTYTLAFKWETWDIQFLNHGNYYWPGGKPVDITGKFPSTDLAKHGEVLRVNLLANGDVNRSSTPTYTRIRFFREINFTALGIT